MTVVAQYANGRENLPFSLSNVAVSSGGSTTASYTYYFVLQAENRCGLTQQSTIVGPVEVTAGQRVTITIPSTSKETGEEWLNFIVSAGTTATPSQFRQIASIKADTSLPATIVLSRDEHFLLSPTVAAAANLPTGTDLIEGMMRGLTSTSRYYYYDPESTDTADGTFVVTAATGRWITIGSPFTYVSDVEASGGTRQDVRTINSGDVKIPKYVADGGGGEAIGFWISNQGSSSIESGARIGLVVELNEAAATNTFNGLLRVRMNGFVNRDTGVLRITDAFSNPLVGIGVDYTFAPRKTNLILPDDLGADEAFYISVYPAFTPEELQGRIPNNSQIKVFPTFYTQPGEYNEAGALFGDCIFAEYDRGRVVPSSGLTVRALKRSGLVDSYSFRAISESIVAGLLSNTANQKISINANGSVFLDTIVDDPEALRAIVSTEAGTTAPSAYSANFTLTAGQDVLVTCNYPCTSAGVGTIRANYPDVVAGNNKATFNPLSVKVYIRRVADNVIREYTQLVIADTSQQFLIESWSAGVITSLPSPASNFGLFAPGTCIGEATGSGSDFTAGDYQVCFSFHHTGNNVTKISHAESDGCIHEVAYTIAEISNAAKYWSTHVSTLASLRSVPLAQRFDGQIRAVRGLDNLYLFNSTSTGVDDTTSSSEYAKPNDLSIGDPGRWVVYNKFINSGTVSTLSPSTPATAEIVNVGGTPTLNLGIPKGDPGVDGLDGAPGAAAYTLTTATFVQPAINGTVTVAVSSSDWIATGQNVYHATGGYYSVVSTPSSTSVILTNLGYLGNAAATTTVGIGRLTASGFRGPTGSQGPAGESYSPISIAQAFTQPSVSADVTVTVDRSDWMVAGLNVFHENGGWYIVDSTPSLTSVVLTNTGETGNAAPASTVLSGKIAAGGVRGPTGSQGAQGPAGSGSSGADGLPPISTASSFTQPAVDFFVTVTVDRTDWMVVGLVVFHESVNYYKVNQINSDTEVVLQNLGYAGASAETSLIPSGKVITGGLSGPTGATGGGGATDAVLLNNLLSIPDDNFDALQVYQSGNELFVKLQGISGTRKVAYTDEAQTRTAASRTAIFELSGSPVAWNMELANVYELNVSTSRTISNPSNLVNGDQKDLIVRNTGAGSIDITLSSNIKLEDGVANPFAVGASKQRILRCTSRNNRLYCSLSGEFTP